MEGDTGSEGASALMASDPPPTDYDVPGDFKYDQNFVTKIATTLSVNEKYVIQGCYYSSLGTDGRPLEHDEIMAWVLENHPRFVEITSDNEDSQMDDTPGGHDTGLKMVLVVNDELKMTPGKMAAQVAHGALELYASMTQDPKCLEAVQEWIGTGAKKIVLKCKDTEELFDLRAEAEDVGVKYAQISDAGHTQVASGSVTCLAVFGQAGEVNKVTGNLRLLE